MMDKKKNGQNGSAVKTAEESLVFEIVDEKDNLVKAISYLNGKKQEVLFYAVPQDLFELLIPPVTDSNISEYKIAAG
jgi:hypothetical protein